MGVVVITIHSAEVKAADIGGTSGIFCVWSYTLHRLTRITRLLIYRSLRHRIPRQIRQAIVLHSDRDEGDKARVGSDDRGSDSAGSVQGERTNCVT